MAFRSPCYSLLRNGLIRGKATYATTTGANLEKTYKVADDKASKTVKKHGAFVPVYVSLGLVLTALGFGAHAARQQLMYSPTVHVRKSRREGLPDVFDPDSTLEDSEKFIKKSFFRKVAHIQEFNSDDKTKTVADPTRGDVFTRPIKAETLKTVGVEPKAPEALAKAAH